jgi:hypothetical protein
MNALQSNELTKVMMLAERKHWWIKPLGVEEPITKPIYRNGWWFVPLKEDKSIIPSKAIRRVKELRKIGIRIGRIIVAHEAPKELCAPIQPKPIRVPSKQVHTSTDLSGLVGVLVMALPYLLLAPLFIDPALIVQLPDGTLVEVMRWLS